MNVPIPLVGVLAGAATMMLCAGAALSRPSTRLSRSLRFYAMPALAEERRDTPRSTLRELLPNVTGVWDAASSRGLLRGLSLSAGRLEPWLTRQVVHAGLSMTPRELLVLAGFLALGGAALAYLVWGTLVMAISAATGALVGLLGYVRHLQRRRLRVFSEQLPEVLSMLIISLRAGLGVMQALDAISKRVRAPASQELAAVIRETHLGVSAELSLKHLAQRVNNEDLHLLVNAITIQRETGGNLVTMVETIEDTVRERVKIRGEVRALTAQATMGGWIITLLPVVLGAFLYLINPSGMSFFWTSWMGAALGGMAVVSVVSGNVVLRRITRIEL